MMQDISAKMECVHVCLSVALLIDAKLCYD